MGVHRLTAYVGKVSVVLGCHLISIRIVLNKGS